MSVVIGILRNPDGVPCVEAPDSPVIRYGEKETLLSLDEANKAVGWNALDIASVHAVTITRKFNCLKSSFPQVAAWLSGLATKAAQYNAGADGEAVLPGFVPADAEITMDPNGPTLAIVTATWTGYVLDVNYRLPQGMTWERVGELEYVIKIDGNVVMRLTADGPGDRSGISLRAEAPVAFSDLPDDVRSKVGGWSYGGLPATAAECQDGALYKDRVFRPICLCVNGEIATRWWVEVYPDGYSTKVLRCRKMYYGWNVPGEVETPTKPPASAGDVDVEYEDKQPSGYTRFNVPKIQLNVLVSSEGDVKVWDPEWNGGMGGWRQAEWDESVAMWVPLGEASRARARAAGDEPGQNAQLFYKSARWTWEWYGASGSGHEGDMTGHQRETPGVFALSDAAWVDKPSVFADDQTVAEFAEWLRGEIVSFMEDNGFDTSDEEVAKVFDTSWLSAFKPVLHSFDNIPEGTGYMVLNEPYQLEHAQYNATEVRKEWNNTAMQTRDFTAFGTGIVQVKDAGAETTSPIDIGELFTSIMQAEYSESLAQTDVKFNLSNCDPLIHGFNYYGFVGYAFIPEDAPAGEYDAQNVVNALALYWSADKGKIALHADHRLGNSVLVSFERGEA